MDLEIGTAIGTRSYEFATSVSEEIATLDRANGSITLTGYEFGHSVQLNVSEAETQDYKALDSTLVTVFLDLADSGDADKYTQLDSAQTVVISTLSGPEFANLQESEFGVMGARSVREPTDTELAQYGKGKVVFLNMKPVGNDDPAKTRGLWMHVARFDGCRSQLSENDTKPFLAVDYSDAGYCENGSSIRMTRFLVIDDRPLDANTAYESMSPLIHYRKGAREFLASDAGGFYAEPDTIYGEGKYGYPKSLYEWAVVSLNYQKN